MKAKLKIIEIKTGTTVDLPGKITPVKLEPVMEMTGVLTVPVPTDRFMLYYLEREK
jgi:hypothetical protein